MEGIILNKKYIIKRKIGKGSYGEVFIVNDNYNNILAAKQVNIIELNEELQNSSLLEVDLLQHLKHPNIVQYIDSFIEDTYLYIIMEYCEYGDLDSYINNCINNNILISEYQIIDWIIQIGLALNFIHNNKILHRDLKCSNIFLSKDNIIKLGDFGICKILDETLQKAKTMIGTVYYMSPEVCLNKPYSFKSDVWSFGIILYELCCLKKPFDANSFMKLANKIIEDNYEEINYNYSPNLRNLINSMLFKDSSKRPSIYDVWNQDFVLDNQSYLPKENKNKNSSKLYLKNLIQNEKEKKRNLNIKIKESNMNSQLRKKINSENWDKKINFNFQKHTSILFDNQKQETYRGNPNYIIQENLTNHTDSNFSSNTQSNTFGNTIITQDFDNLEVYNTEMDEENQLDQSEKMHIENNYRFLSNRNINDNKYTKITKLKEKISNFLGNELSISLINYIKNNLNLNDSQLAKGIFDNFKYIINTEMLKNLQEIIYFELEKS